MLSTKLACHTCHTPGTAVSPWKDKTALQHAEIPGSCTTFVDKTGTWWKNGTMIYEQLEARLYSCYWSSAYLLPTGVKTKKRNVWKSFKRNWELQEVADKALLQGFHTVVSRTLELRVVWAHMLASAWEKGAQEGLALGRKWEHCTLSPSPFLLFSALGFVFQSLHTSTFLDVIWK